MHKVVKNKKLDYNVFRNDLDMCVTLGKEIDSMLSVIDKDADYNTFSKNVGKVCIKMYLKRLS